MNTLRTDAAEILYSDCTHAHCQDESHLSGDFADFARQLETELSAMTALADRMAEALRESRNTHLDTIERCPTIVREAITAYETHKQKQHE